MAQQTIKQRARRQAASMAARHRRERAEREKRLQDLAVQVLTAVGERDAAVAEYEQRVSAALQHMVEVEGLSQHEALDWCGESVSMREATRLRQIGSDTNGRGAAASVADGAGRESVGM